MKRFQTLGRKLITCLLAAAIVFSTIPFGQLSGLGDNTAYAASYSGKASEKNNGSYTFKTSKFMEIWVADYQNLELYKASCSEMGYPVKQYFVDDFLVFCAEHGVHVEDRPVTYTANTRLRSDFAKSYKAIGKDYVIDNMSKVLLYGPVEGSGISELMDMGFRDSAYHNDGNTYKVSDWYAATQMLLWECQQLFRTETFSLTKNGLHYQTGYHGASTDEIEKEHYLKVVKGTPGYDIYKWMVQEVKARLKEENSISAQKITLPWKDASGIYYTDSEMTMPVSAANPFFFTVKASKKVALVTKKGDLHLNNFEVTYDAATKTNTIRVKSQDAVQKIADGKAYIMLDDSVYARAAAYRNGKNGDKYDLLFWEYKTADSHAQGFISGLDDPIVAPLIPVANTISNPTPIPEGECGPGDVTVFPTVSLPIKKVDANKGWDDDNTTPMGDATLGATFTVERQINGGEWESLDDASVILDDYGSVEIISDKPFHSAQELAAYRTESDKIDTCDHPIYDEDGTTVIGYMHEGEKIKKVDWNVTVNYRVTEHRPDGRYIDPDPFGGVREYAFTYEAHTQDTCEYFCHDDPWTDIEYTFTVTPIKGEGITVTVNGVESEITEDVCASEETIVDDEQRGDIQIIKSNEADNAFLPSGMGSGIISKNSTWTIRLKDGGMEGEEYVHLVSATPEILAGGTAQYTASRDSGGYVLSETNTMKVGTNGTLIIKDLPYGTYVVSEISADDPMYVLEEFIVTIDEHNATDQATVPETGSFAGYDKTGTNMIGAVASGTGDYYNNRYDVNLRDKKKTNVIKIEKTDAETGKTVRAEGTKVFIRYTGIPDFSDEENEKRYGETGTVAAGILNRFLPNAESISSASTNYVFELDENGEVIIPYELPYGTYEVFEWLLPEGYFVGEYTEDGHAASHDYGLITENDLAAGIGHQYEDLVAIYDPDGKHVIFDGEDKYSFGTVLDMVSNIYHFEVTQQQAHVDGNFSQLVTYQGETSAADPSYQKGDYRYQGYYRIVSIPNNQVKGKIEIVKEGEALVGWKEEEKTAADGSVVTILTPVYETVKKIKDAVFGIFAAEDVNLKDGSDGPKIYDSDDDSEIVIPKTVSSHLSNIAQTVTAFFGKWFAKDYENKANYETGSYSDESGAQLWYMLERAASSGNVKRTLYVTPEQKDTKYTYIYEDTDGTYNYRWDVDVTLQNQAGGDQVTKVNVTKTTSTANGYAAEIPTTKMSGSVGDHRMEEVENYMTVKDPVSSERSSVFDVRKFTYAFEENGGTEIFHDGVGYEDGTYLFPQDTILDLSSYTPDRYIKPEYTLYKLTAADVKATEAEVVVDYAGFDSDGDGKYNYAGYDANGNGSFEDAGDRYPDIAPITHQEIPTIQSDAKAAELEFTYAADGVTPKAVKVKMPATKYDASARRMTFFEQEKNVILKTAAAGDPAIAVKGEESYQVAVTGFYIADQYTSLKAPRFSWKDSDQDGKVLSEYTLPAGYTEAEWQGEAGTDPHYVLAEDGAGNYQVLLDDQLTWQSCDKDANYQKAIVQVYEITYTQQHDDANGFTLDWDGMHAEGSIDPESLVATFDFTKQDAGCYDNVDLGLGWESQREGNSVSFGTVEIKAPIYFMWDDGVKVQMQYRGNKSYTRIDLPQSAVDHLYSPIVPTLTFWYQDTSSGTPEDKEMTLNWYEKLTPSHLSQVYDKDCGLPSGTTVKATRNDPAVIGEETTYTIEIVTTQTEEYPLTLTFADAYKMDIYNAISAEGNGVGILDLYNTYKTTRFTASTLIETVTTKEDGTATSSLLPLGDYIVRELSAPDGYVNSEENESLVSLTYENQFTPLVWESASFGNNYKEVEIEIAKGFETEYGSGEFASPAGGQMATFGLYAAEDILQEKEGTKAVDKIAALKDSLLDVCSASADADGHVWLTAKLPAGKYYIREISSSDPNFIVSDAIYYFEVKESVDDIGTPETFSYKQGDGIEGSIVLMEKNHTRTTILYETRYPMGEITIDGMTYALDMPASINHADGERYIKIKTDSAYSIITVDTYAGQTADIVLPNGKVITVTPSKDSFTWSNDGVEKSSKQEIAYVSYEQVYTEPWLCVYGQDPETENENPVATVRTFTLIGTGKEAGKKIEGRITHTPQNEAYEMQLDNEDSPGTVTAYRGVLDKGVQVYTHEGAFRIDGGRDFLLKPGETHTEILETGAILTITMDEGGSVEVRTANTQTEVVTSEGSVTASDRVPGQKLTLTRSSTLKRMDSVVEKTQIKINTSDDGILAGRIENRMKPDVDLKKIEKDAATEVLLSGATFSVWKAIPETDGTFKKGELIGSFTSDKEGVADLGKLDYGTYIYKETAAPYGYKLDAAEKVFEVAEGNGPYVFFVENEKTTTPPGDGGFTPLAPEVKTAARDAETNLQLSNADDAVTIIDTVYTYNLKTDGTEYVVKGIFMDQETGKPVLIGGKQVTAEKRFTPASANGSVDMTFTLDARTLKGKDVVVFETLYEIKVTLDEKTGEKTETEKEIAKHEDIHDAHQTISFPEIKTSASDAETGSNAAKADESVTIQDVVKYENLEPGTYTVKGTLMDKSTKKPLADGGKEITASKTFTVNTSNASGEVTLTFGPFDGHLLSGTAAVVFEKVYVKTKDIQTGAVIEAEVGSHEDINDQDQTVTIGEVSIRTSATSRNGYKKVKPAASLTIIDEVTYTGLKEGAKYTLKGTLMDQETGKALLVNGKQVASEVTFTAKAANGSITMTFPSINTSEWENKKVVVYERLYAAEKIDEYQKGDLVAKHTDINDEGQTVEVSAELFMKTVATTKNGYKIASTADNLTIVDTVSYSGLVPGKEYKLKGTLMEKETGKAVLTDGKKITSTITFVPEKESGEVKISFTFDCSDWEDTQVVVFERLYANEVIGDYDKGKEVICHEDLEDKDQTVTLRIKPAISTAADVDGKKNVKSGEIVTVNDTVTYCGLKEGKKYTLKGSLINAKTGRAIRNPDGSKVTATKTFTAAESSGQVTLRFTVDTTDWTTTTTVVYERLYAAEDISSKIKNGDLVAEHTDKTDQDQTVYFVEKDGYLEIFPNDLPPGYDDGYGLVEVPKTVDHMYLTTLYCLLALVTSALVLLVMLFIRRRKAQKQ